MCTHASTARSSRVRKKPSYWVQVSAPPFPHTTNIPPTLLHGQLNHVIAAPLERMRHLIAGPPKETDGSQQGWCDATAHAWDFLLGRKQPCIMLQGLQAWPPQAAVTQHNATPPKTDPIPITRAHQVPLQAHRTHSQHSLQSQSEESANTPERRACQRHVSPVPDKGCVRQSMVCFLKRAPAVTLHMRARAHVPSTESAIRGAL